MRAFFVTALLSASVSTSLLAEESNFNPDTARAYEGYLVTFLWPEGQTKEQIDYQNVYVTDHLLRLPTTQTDEQTSNNIKPESTPANYEDNSPLAKVEQQLSRRVTMLSHQKWTLIFKDSGDTLQRTFYSEQQKDGYPELTGTFKVTLGRYLESDIRYQHYLFDSFSQPVPAVTSDNPFDVSESDIVSKFKAFEPGLVLNLHQSNKTASKKVNYLDHPTIGTLLYFEPLDLEVAMERMASKAVVPETGNSLTYDALNSTNELVN
ncbi:hypothetical protein J9B83_09490 [Marinomonas sp. A79]|uniref:Peptidoglycan-binding protein CsiV n=1 Tax=Marinomonas vulgaris TaxID=2823372 RepID=A0ABS5HCP9_9GAMM|nr:CsiV family protein [Marinomonas vulgaris]MBR7889174.1 hypothetical protein [Marinomonas vulgaris]